MTYLKRYLFLSALLTSSIIASPCYASEPLKARGELSYRPGTERNIMVGEFWVPLAQDENGVLYGDYRFMGDSDDAREFNAGIGYREVIRNDYVGEGVVGVHGWYDRRLTPRGSKFNQVTGGVEWFGEHFDIKANTYIPLNKKKTHSQANPNGTDGRLAGSQIVVNTDQVVVEEALTGIDFELGYNLPFLQEYTDSTRVYGGAYHFEGDDAENVSGWRTRISADITEDIQIGGRFQRDDVRGSQSFLDLTIRFPFGQKQSFKEYGVRARLDESPERDIDIVSNEAITDDGNDKVLVNTATGLTQNIIVVDSNAAMDGDGSAENPFNLLSSAQTAAGDNDLIYVIGGGATLTGGITLADVGQKLVGSGSDLTLDDLGVAASNGQGFAASNGVVIGKTTAPVITNAGGNGIDVTADDVTVSGVTVDGAANRGIAITNNAAGEWDSFILRDVSIMNNLNRGVVLEALNGGIINSSLIEAVTLSRNTLHGISVASHFGSSISNLVIRNTSSSQNTGSGLTIISNQVGSQINNINVSNFTSSNNGGRGVHVIGIDDALLEGLVIENSVVTDNAYNGIYIYDNNALNISADLGGGTEGSEGKNSIYNNLSEDIRVDLDGGELKAENNYWGNNVGLQPSQVQLDEMSTIDTDPFLTEAP